MGNSTSTPLEHASKHDVVRRVSALGKKYEGYAMAIDENGVDGPLLADMNDEEFEETLDELGVTSRLHRRKLTQEFRRSQSSVSLQTPVTDESTSSSWSDSEFLLPPRGPIPEVHLADMEDRVSDYPMPEEVERIGEERDSHLLPNYQEGRATAEQQKHLAPDFFKAIDGVDGFRPPIPADDMERVAQVQAYGFENIEPGSEIAKTLTGYVEMATKLFTFDFGDITFFDQESQLSYARVGLTDHIKKAIVGKVYTPLNYGADNEAFLCKTDRSIGICNYPSLTKRTFVVHDIHKDKTFKWMATVWPFRCYVGTPILSPSGLVLGTLCLHNLEPRPDFSRAHEVQLEQISRMVAQSIENWALRSSISRLQSERAQLTNVSNSNKASPPMERAAFVLTDIEGSTTLWEKKPEAMKQALELHDDLMRKIGSKYFAYEVTTEGDSFLLAFHDAADAFGFCLELQEKLYDAPWSDEILAFPEACDNNNGFRGLRVRMGVHMGPVTSAEKSQVTGRTEYTGPTLDLTRAVEAMANGGQILTTSDTWAAVSFLTESKLGSPQVVDLGSHVLNKGKLISDGVIAKTVLQIVPSSLAVQYNKLKYNSPEMAPEDTPRGRSFPEVKTLKKLSKSFFDAPRENGNEVTIAFVGTKEIEEKCKDPAAISAQVIGLAASLLPGTEGYQCQENMLAFPNVTEAAKFGIRLMDLLKGQKPLEDGTNLSRLVTFGCVHGPFVTLEPHKTTGRADYFGKVVNRAARVAYSSKPGRVSVGVPVTDNFNSENFTLDDKTIKLKFTGTKELKGVEDEIAVFAARRERWVRGTVFAWFGYFVEDWY